MRRQEDFRRRRRRQLLQLLLQHLQVVDRLLGVAHLIEDLLHLAHLHLAAADAEGGRELLRLVRLHQLGEGGEVAQQGANLQRRLVHFAVRTDDRVAELGQRGRRRRFAVAPVLVVGGRHCRHGC